MELITIILCTYLTLLIVEGIYVQLRLRRGAGDGNPEFLSARDT